MGDDERGQIIWHRMFSMLAQSVRLHLHTKVHSPKKPHKGLSVLRLSIRSRQLDREFAPPVISRLRPWPLDWQGQEYLQAQWPRVRLRGERTKRQPNSAPTPKARVVEPVM